MGKFYRLQYYFPRKILVNLYYSLVYPYLLYCVISWGGTYHSCLAPLKVLQKRIVRLLAGSHYLAHSEPLFARLKILRVDDIYRFVLAQYMFHNRGSLIYRHPDAYHTRGANLLAPVFRRLSMTQKSVGFAGPKLWNSLPLNVREIESFYSFKRAVRAHLLQSYNPTV